MNVRVSISDVDFQLDISNLTPFTASLVVCYLKEKAEAAIYGMKLVEQPVDPTPTLNVVMEPLKPKRAYVRHKTLNFTKERDRILRDNFEELGHGGIFDKSLLPGFSLAEIRQRCIELGLLDKYGNRVEKRGKVKDD